MKEEFVSNVPISYMRYISPEDAEKILEECNTHNRNVKKATVSAYKRDMENGNWIYDGSPIRFGKDGTLYDGQHRLMAVAKSGCGQEFLVIIGLDQGTQLVMDTGATRSPLDNLRLSTDYNYPVHLISGINFACGAFRGVDKITRSMTKDIIEKYRDDVDFVCQYISCKGLRRASITSTALLALKDGRTKDVVGNYLAIVTKGKYSHLTPGESTLMRFREKMLMQSSGNRGRNYVTQEVKLAQRVFIAYENNTELTKLYIPTAYSFEFYDIGKEEV